MPAEAAGQQQTRLEMNFCLYYNMISVRIKRKKMSWHE